MIQFSDNTRKVFSQSIKVVADSEGGGGDRDYPILKELKRTMELQHKEYHLFFVSNTFFILWRRGVVVITTAQLHSTELELRFCAGSSPARGVPEIRDGENLWQWSRLEIRLNTFRRSTTPQKQLIIIINSSSFVNLMAANYSTNYQNTMRRII